MLEAQRRRARLQQKRRSSDPPDLTFLHFETHHFPDSLIFLSSGDFFFEKGQKNIAVSNLNTNTMLSYVGWLSVVVVFIIAEKARARWRVQKADLDKFYVFLFFIV